MVGVGAVRRRAVSNVPQRQVKTDKELRRLEPGNRESEVLNPSPLPKVGLGMRRSAIGEARHDDRQLKSDGFFDMNGVVWSGDFASRNGVVGSDVDILVSFDGPATSRTLLRRPVLH